MNFFLLVYTIMEEICGSGFKQNSWLMYCKYYQGEHGCSWKEALKGAKESYSQKKKKLGGTITLEDIERMKSKGIKVDGDGGKWVQKYGRDDYTWFKKAK